MQTSDEEVFSKFIIRRIRDRTSPTGYTTHPDCWNVAFPGPFDQPAKTLRFSEWETALAVAIYGVGYIERKGWDAFEARVIKHE